MFRLKLASVPNPDHDEWFSPAPTRYVTVKSLKDASRKCREYIEEFNLGSGNWSGGQVSQNRKRIAEISYNGRIWSQKIQKHV
jgi:hypothetical protein